MNRALCAVGGSLLNIASAVDERSTTVLRERTPIEPSSISTTAVLRERKRREEFPYDSWKYVTTNDKIWEYVKKRFDVNEDEKKYVLKTINDNWRLYKNRLKMATYQSFETMEERLDNHPQHIPGNQFKEFLEFWDSDLAKQQNHPNKKLPSQVELYIESRKRAPGRTYKTDPMPAMQNIEKIREIQSLSDRIGKGDPYYDVITKKEHSGRLRLYGRCVTKKNLKENEGKAPFVLPSMYMESIEEHLEQKITSKILSQLKEANPGINIVIPNFRTTSGDGDEVGGSNETSHFDEDYHSDQDHQQVGGE